MLFTISEEEKRKGERKIRDGRLGFPCIKQPECEKLVRKNGEKERRNLSLFSILHLLPLLFLVLPHESQVAIEEERQGQ